MNERVTKTYQNSIKSARPATTLGVSKSCNTRIEPKTFSKDILDVFCANRLKIRIVCTLGDNDDCFTLASFPVL
jgi:hypothetical protein